MVQNKIECSSLKICFASLKFMNKTRTLLADIRPALKHCRDQTL
jgi:hypothetical protein